MKINGQPIPNIIAVATAIIPRPGGQNLSFKIRSIPVGFVDKIDDELPAPTAPYVTISKDGKKVSKQDLEDKQFRKDLERHIVRLNTLIIHYGLSVDSSLTFDAKKGEKLSDFADSLRLELEKDGLSKGDLIVDQIDHLSNDTMEQIKEARNRFLSVIRGVPESEDGSSPITTA